MKQEHLTLGGLGVLVAMLAGCGAGGPIEIPAGFAGTETRSGRYGGPQDASGFGNGCRGFVSNNPDHQLQIAAPLGHGRFIVNGGTRDTTLVVQTADGNFHCNDDAEGVNPIVDIPNLPAGLVKVWVGSYSAEQTGNYKFGFSTNPTTTAASLGAPTQSSQRRTRRRRRRRRRR